MNRNMGNITRSSIPSVQSLLKEIRWQVNTRSFQLVCELGPYAGGGECAQRPPVFPDALLFEDEYVLHAHHVVFHSGELGDVRDPARSIGKASNLDYQRYGRSDLFANGFLRKVEVRHHRHGFHTCDGIARAVGVDRSKRAIVASIHGLEHVERFFATDLAYDDAIGAHSQTVDHQVPLQNRALTFHVGGTTLQADNVTLLHL